MTLAHFTDASKMSDYTADCFELFDTEGSGVFVYPHPPHPLHRRSSWWVCCLWCLCGVWCVGADVCVRVTKGGGRGKDCRCGCGCVWGEQGRAIVGAQPTLWTLQCAVCECYTLFRAPGGLIRKTFSLFFPACDVLCGVVRCGVGGGELLCGVW